MKINGLQKLTLLDYPGKLACTVFLAGCNLRCPYCHNSELISKDAPALMDGTEFLDFLSKRKGTLEGVCFTGGEPLMYPGLEDLISEVKSLGYLVKLDTNGCFPDKLKNLLAKGLLDYVAMDIKNSKEKYAQAAGIEGLSINKIEESVEILKTSGIDFEFRTTVVAELHDESSFEGIGKWIESAPKYFLQAFADRDSVVFSGLHAPSAEDMAKYQEILAKYGIKASIRGM